MVLELGRTSHLYTCLEGLASQPASESALVQLVKDNLQIIADLYKIQHTDITYSYDPVSCCIKRNDEKFVSAERDMASPPRPVMAHVEGLFLFMCEKVHKLAVLKIEGSNKNLDQYYSEHYTEIDRGLSYLHRFYSVERWVKLIDFDLWRSVNTCLHLSSRLQYGLHMSATLLENKITHVPVRFEEEDFKTFPLLDEIMKIRNFSLGGSPGNFSDTIPFTLFEKKTPEFITACINIEPSLQEQELTQIVNHLIKISTTYSKLSDNRELNNTPEWIAFMHYILKNKHFSPLHDYVRCLVVCTKENLESPDKFDLVMTALEPLQIAIQAIRANGKAQKEQQNEISNLLLELFSERVPGTIFCWAGVLCSFPKTAALLRFVLPESLKDEHLIFYRSFFDHLFLTFNNIFQIDEKDPKNRMALGSCAVSAFFTHFTSQVHRGGNRKELEDWLERFPEARLLVKDIF